MLHVAGYAFKAARSWLQLSLFMLGCSSLLLFVDWGTFFYAIQLLLASAPAANAGTLVTVVHSSGSAQPLRECLYNNTNQ
jgi:hypothetical protein